MFKQVVLLIALSVGIVFSMSNAQQIVQMLISAHDWVSELLTEVFAGGHAGSIAKNLLALLAIPVIAGLIPAFFYWLLRRNLFPYFMHIVWVVWLVQAGALIMLYQAA